MKKVTNILPVTAIIISVSLNACMKKEPTFDEEISQEDNTHYNAMKFNYEQARIYQDSLKLCSDSILSNCNINNFDSLFHLHMSAWEEHHNLYSHSNPIDDHHHNAETGNHEHCGHCSTEGHSLADHDAINELQQEHKPYHP